MGSTVLWDGPRPQPHRGGGQLSRKTIIFSIFLCGFKSGVFEGEILHGAESFLKSVVPKLAKKTPECYRTQKFVTAFVTDRHLCLYWARSVQSTPSQTDIFKICFNIILPTPVSAKWSRSVRFRHENPECCCPLPHSQHTPHRSHSA